MTEKIYRTPKLTGGAWPATVYGIVTPMRAGKEEGDAGANRSGICIRERGFSLYDSRTPRCPTTVRRKTYSKSRNDD